MKQTLRGRKEKYYKFYLPEFGGHESIRDFTSMWSETELEYLVQDIAEHYHNDCEGWECEWPIQFCVLNSNGDKLGTFWVEREYNPTFLVSMKEN